MFNCQGPQKQLKIVRPREEGNNARHVSGDLEFIPDIRNFSRIPYGHWKLSTHHVPRCGHILRVTIKGRHTLTPIDFAFDPYVKTTRLIPDGKTVHVTQNLFGIRRLVSQINRELERSLGPNPLNFG